MKRAATILALLLTGFSSPAAARETLAVFTNRGACLSAYHQAVTADWKDTGDAQDGRKGINPWESSQYRCFEIDGLWYFVTFR